jgi:hypothetical protein
MSPKLIKELKDNFPCRVYTPDQNLQEYLVYVGKHLLAQSLIDRFTNPEVTTDSGDFISAFDE